MIDLYSKQCRIASGKSDGYRSKIDRVQVIGIKIGAPGRAVKLKHWHLDDFIIWPDRDITDHPQLITIRIEAIHGYANLLIASGIDDFDIKSLALRSD